MNMTGTSKLSPLWPEPTYSPISPIPTVVDYWPENTLPVFVTCPACRQLRRPAECRHCILLNDVPTKICAACAQRLGLLPTVLQE